MKNKYFIYIVIGAYNLSGVRSKLAGKIQALNQELGEVKCLYFCNDIREIMQEGNITFIPFYFDGEIPNFWKKAIFWRFQEYYIRKQKFKIINNTLKQLNQFSGIVFRYIPSDFNSLIFGLKYFKKIIYEHNTFESEELKLIRNSTVKQYYQISEKLFGPFVRMFAKCLILLLKEVV